mmetsp:Transcript_43939/g.116112  ORF Transcript_43939/g.116112 Transcript_43939/m.116112 type:complete len:211 (-) Transcript_43939:277-909(-)
MRSILDFAHDLAQSDVDAVPEKPHQLAESVAQYNTVFPKVNRSTVVDNGRCHGQLVLPVQETGKSPELILNVPSAAEQRRPIILRILIVVHHRQCLSDGDGIKRSNVPDCPPPQLEQDGHLPVGKLHLPCLLQRSDGLLPAPLQRLLRVHLGEVVHAKEHVLHKHSHLGNLSEWDHLPRGCITPERKLGRLPPAVASTNVARGRRGGQPQ